MLSNNTMQIKIEETREGLCPKVDYKWLLKRERKNINTISKLCSTTLYNYMTAITSHLSNSSYN